MGVLDKGIVAWGGYQFGKWIYGGGTASKTSSQTVRDQAHQRKMFMGILGAFTIAVLLGVAFLCKDDGQSRCSDTPITPNVAKAFLYVSAILAVFFSILACMDRDHSSRNSARMSNSSTSRSTPRPKPR